MPLRFESEGKEYPLTKQCLAAVSRAASWKRTTVFIDPITLTEKSEIVKWKTCPLVFYAAVGTAFATISKK